MNKKMKLFRYLPEPEKGWKLTRLAVVSPYFSLKFFDALKDKYGKLPPTVTLIVDDSADLEALAAIREAHEGRIHGHFASAPGLAHLKLYYLHLSKKISSPGQKSKTYSRHYVYWGSANASEGGFDLNAESLSFVCFKPKDFPKLHDYCNSLCSPAPEDYIPGVCVKFGNAKSGLVSLVLPDLKVSDDSPLETFDAWLQARIICHKYVPAQAFLKLTVNLKKELPPSDEGKIFNRQGFGNDSNARQLRYSYLVGEANEGLATNGSPRWQARYFIETAYGLWCSRECRQDSLKSEANGVGPFVAQKSEQRSVHIDRLRKMAGTSERENVTHPFLNALQGAAKWLIDEGKHPAEYLECEAATQQVSLKHYERLAIKQINDDIKLANNEYFANRYIEGYELQPMAKCRADTVSWEEFCLSFCESIIAKQGRLSKFVKALKDDFEALGLYITNTNASSAEKKKSRERVKASDYLSNGTLQPKQLLSLLREHWDQFELVPYYHRRRHSRKTPPLE